MPFHQISASICLQILTASSLRLRKKDLEGAHFVVTARVYPWPGVARLCGTFAFTFRRMGVAQGQSSKVGFLRESTRGSTIFFVADRKSKCRRSSNLDLLSDCFLHCCHCCTCIRMLKPPSGLLVQLSMKKLVVKTRIIADHCCSLTIMDDHG